MLALGLVANLSNPIALVLSSIWTPLGKAAHYYVLKQILRILRVGVGTIELEGKRTHLSRIFSLSFPEALSAPLDSTVHHDRRSRDTQSG